MYDNESDTTPETEGSAHMGCASIHARHNVYLADEINLPDYGGVSSDEYAHVGCSNILND